MQEDSQRKSTERRQMVRTLKISIPLPHSRCRMQGAWQAPSAVVHPKHFTFSIRASFIISKYSRGKKTHTTLLFIFCNPIKFNRHTDSQNQHQRNTQRLYPSRKLGHATTGPSNNHPDPSPLALWMFLRHFPSFCIQVVFPKQLPPQLLWIHATSSTAVSFSEYLLVISEQFLAMFICQLRRKLKVISKSNSCHG